VKIFGVDIFGQSGATRDPSDDFWYTDAPSSGGRPTANAIAGMSAVSSCVRVISESIGMLPLGIFAREANGDKVSRDEHPLADLLKWQSNEEQTAIEFREELTAHVVQRGTGIAEIIPGQRGAVDQLIPLRPDHIKAIKVEDTSGRAHWQIEHEPPGEPRRRLMREDLFIVRGRPNPECPILGIDPLSHHMQALGSAYQATEYGKRFLENDARPPGIITHPSYFKDEEGRNVFLRAWHRAFGGGNRGKTAILEHGMTYTAVSVTPEQAQFLETRKYTDVDVARIFRVPPHEIGILDRATFSNIEHQSLEFVKKALMRWLVAWEQAIRRDLLTSRAFFAEHNVAGLLRGDLKARYSAYALGRQWGWLSVNDIRRLENMPSLGAEGDVYLEPLNMHPAGHDEENEQMQSLQLVGGAK
jgi:HK97 family phage portal protein